MPGVGQYQTSVDDFSPQEPVTLSTWNRVEPRPRAEDFDRSLKAEVRDPLWMLCRQWQWGEFKGEDTGSPIFMKLHSVSRKMTRLALGDQAHTVYDASMADVPLEARVEHLPIVLDEAMAIKIGRRWKQELTAQGVASYYADFLSQYAFDAAPTEDQDGVHYFTNTAVIQHRNATKGRTIDGRKLVEHLDGGGDASDNITITTSGDDALLDAAGVSLMNWLNALYYQPLASDNPAWDRSRLEYRFSAAIPENIPGDLSSTSATALVADQYNGGNISWNTMDISPADLLSSGFTSGLLAAEDSTTSEFKTTMIPTGIQFPGMPAERWWEFEDHKVNFSSLKANSTDTARIMMTEFGLVYAHEWNVVPYTLEVGSLSDIQSIVVTDTFGQKVLVEAAGKGEEQSWQRWNMFNLNTVETVEGNTADLRMFIPPSSPRIQESDPIERVRFFRDEMSNMVWAIEDTIPDEFGGGRDGNLAATHVTKYYESLADQPVSGQLANNTDPIKGVNLNYKLNTSVPENWIPFIPVQPGALVVSATNRNIQLQRGTMSRYIDRLALDTNHQFVRPRSWLIGEDLSNPLYIFEEEVPRSGSRVELTYQRSRWFNGKTVVWAGARKRNGGGEGTSGLLFDKLTASFKN